MGKSFLSLKSLCIFFEQLMMKQQISKCCTLETFEENDDIQNYNLRHHSNQKPSENLIRVFQEHYPEVSLSIAEVLLQKTTMNCGRC